MHIYLVICNSGDENICCAIIEMFAHTPFWRVGVGVRLGARDGTWEGGVWGGWCSLEVVAWELGRLSESLSSNGGPASGSGISLIKGRKVKILLVCFGWAKSLAGKEILENLLKCYLCFPDTHKDTKGQGLSQDWDLSCGGWQRTWGGLCTAWGRMRRRRGAGKQALRWRLCRNLFGKGLRYLLLLLTKGGGTWQRGFARRGTVDKEK